MIASVLCLVLAAVDCSVVCDCSIYWSYDLLYFFFHILAFQMHLTVSESQIPLKLEVVIFVALNGGYICVCLAHLSTKHEVIPDLAIVIPQCPPYVVRRPPCGVTNLI